MNAAVALSRTTFAPRALRTAARRTHSSTYSRATVKTQAMASDEAPPTVYGVPGSRTQIVEWLALELNFSTKSEALNKTVMASPEYRRIHPFGKIPALQADDGTPVFESGAMLLYIADKAGSLPTPEKRGEAASWVVWWGLLDIAHPANGNDARVELSFLAFNGTRGLHSFTVELNLSNSTTHS
jgi:hypothetical protein